MANELFCPTHGPYDASYGECPFCSGAYKRPLAPPSLAIENDILPTKLSSRTIGYSDYSPSKKYRTEGNKYKLRVFISSTYKDLKEYREAAFKAIHSLLGYSDDMLFWSAEERDASTVSVERVKQCDLVILILAHRYGFIPEGEQYSITELEYRAAKEANIPVHAFLVDNSLPWPPQFIEVENNKKLEEFKSLVEQDVIRKTFHSTDELFGLITQSFHHFIERHRDSLKIRKYFQGTLLTKSPKELLTEPDMIIQIGQSEDELPLLLKINRSKNISKHIDSLARLFVDFPDANELNTLLDRFHEELENYAGSNWSKSQIFPIHKKDGSSENMYVTKKTLTELTSSLLTIILQRARGKPRTDAPIPEDTEIPTNLRVGEYEPDRPALQSAGGKNRFLGLSSVDGRVYSVGISGNDWVEWHPFLFESIFDNFPNCKFRLLNTENDFFYSSYYQQLEEYCLENVNNEGFLDSDIEFSISRQSIGEVIIKISESVNHLHEEGYIHADLKPKNILLTNLGPELIDSFNLKPGELSPGWTVGWSAPEYVSTEPVSFASDIYSLGSLLVRLLNGELKGEIRKFAVPDFSNEVEEFDVFHNPSIFIAEPDVILKHGINEWVSFIKSCLKFDKQLRPQSAKEFANILSELLNKYPLQGDIKFTLDLDKSKIVAATLLGGEKRVARLLSDYELEIV